MPKVSEQDIEDSILRHMDGGDETENPIQKAVDETPVVQETVEEPQQEENTAQEQELTEPEFDLGEGRKVKLSQIKEWEQGNLRQSDYTKKTQEIAEKRKELEELEKFANYLKANPNKLQKVIKVLDEKEEQAQQQEQIMDGLDESDPMFQYMKKQNDALMGEIKALKGNLQQAEMVKRTQEAQNTLNSTLNDSVKAYEFSDDHEKSLHRQLVLSHLKDNPKEYSSEADFKQAIKETSERYYSDMKKISEARIKAYLESKKTPVAQQNNTVASPSPMKIDGDNLQDTIQRMLEQGG